MNKYGRLKTENYLSENNKSTPISVSFTLVMKVSKSSLTIHVQCKRRENILATNFINNFTQNNAEVDLSTEKKNLFC